MVIWGWFLILIKSEVVDFWKMKISKKGGQRGGRYPHLTWSSNYVKNSRFSLKSAFPSFVWWYIRSEPSVRNVAPPFAPPFYASPFAPPFIYTPLGWKIWKNHHFEENTHSSQAPRESCPPFLPPFWHICKVQEPSYIFCIYHFFHKMLCFGCRYACT